MRSYIDIVCDVKDGKPVEKEELRLALLYCADQRYLAEQRLYRHLTAKNVNPLVQSLDKKAQDQTFYTDKQPLEKWWKGNPPKEII